MNRTGKVAFVVGTVLMACFVYGVVRLFYLQADLRDRFPDYSSFRSDPYGAKAFYEALGLMPDVRMRRNLQPLTRLETGPDSAVLLIGVQTYGDINEVEVEYIEAFERIAAVGGRVVIAFYPVPRQPRSRAIPAPSDEKDETPEDGASGEDNRADDSASAESKESESAEEVEGDLEPPEKLPAPAPKTVNLSDRWGIACAYGELPRSEDGGYRPARSARFPGVSLPLPDEISCYSGLYFTRLTHHWRTLYARDEEPVLVERRFGNGSIVLSADSYFLSNEAMRRERHPELLAWLVGPKTDVVFDEYLKGTAERPGIMTLMKRYGLQGLLAALVVLAALVFWQNAASLVPHFPDAVDAAAGNETMGKDATEGLVNLLRRSVPARDLLDVCVREWEAAFRAPYGTGAGIPETSVRRIRELFLTEKEGGGKPDAVETYNRIARFLSDYKWRQPWHRHGV